jgi:Flp pilus assembly protein TadD
MSVEPVASAAGTCAKSTIPQIRVTRLLVCPLENSCPNATINTAFLAGSRKGFPVPATFVRETGFPAEQPVTTERDEPRTARLAIWLVLALTLAVFSCVAHFGFVDWDDSVHVYQNPGLNPVTAAHLAQFWHAPYQGLYIPISYMAYAALAVLGHSTHPLLGPDGAMISVRPVVFHSASLALHLLNVWLVFMLLRRVGAAPWPAAAGALLFGIHPLQVESVAWVSELRGLLAACFGLSSLLVYLGPAADRRSRPRYWLAFVLYLCALLCKPDAVVVPVLALLLDWGLLGRRQRTTLKSVGGWLLAALPIILLTRGAQPAPAFAVPLWLRPVVAGDALAFYLGKFLLPWPLAAVYDRRPDVVLHHAWGYLTWLLPALVAVALWMGRAQRRPLLIAGGLFAVALLPALGLLPFNYQDISTVADRYAYLALLGPALGIAWLLTQYQRPFVPAVCGVALAACGVLTLVQTQSWRDTAHLFAQAATVAPCSPTVHKALAKTDFAQGHPQNAVRELRMALREDPGDPVAQDSLGLILQSEGVMSEAGAHLGQAVALAPRNAKFRLDLAELLIAEHRFVEAQGDLKNALSCDPDLAEAHEDLADLRAQAGDLPGAVAEWQQTVRLWPDDAPAHHDLSVALDRLGRHAEAAAERQQVARVDAKYASLQPGTTE